MITQYRVLVIDFYKPSRISHKSTRIAIYFIFLIPLLKIWEPLIVRGYGVQFNLEFKIGNKPV